MPSYDKRTIMNNVNGFLFKKGAAFAMSTAEKTGIVATIRKFIGDRGGKPFTREDILAELVRDFSDRQPSGMMRTVKMQIYLMKQEGHQFNKQGKRIWRNIF